MTDIDFWEATVFELIRTAGCTAREIADIAHFLLQQRKLLEKNGTTSS